MGDLEQYEMRMLREDERLEYEDATSRVTPDCIQIMGNDGVVHVDTRTASIMSVKFYRHAGDCQDGKTNKWFPELHVSVQQWDNPDVLEYIHITAYKFFDHGESLQFCRKYVGERMVVGGWLDNKEWSFNS